MMGARFRERPGPFFSLLMVMIVTQSVTTTEPPEGSPEVVYRQRIKAFGEAQFARLQGSRRRNGYFHHYLTKIVRHHVLPGSRVLDIGCAAGDMLAALAPSVGVGIDINGAAIAAAREKHAKTPGLHFYEL